MSRSSRARLARGLVLALGLAACAPLPRSERADDGPGAPTLHLRWRLLTSDRTSEVKPQEFAGVAIDGDHNVFTGSANGRFFSLHGLDGSVRWMKRLGSVSSQPLVVADRLFVGTNDGELLAVELDTGDVLWRYETRGPILRRPVLADGMVIFSNEADQVYGVDARTGEFRWQYKGENTPEEYTLRGHAGVTVAGDLVFTGFASGTMVALRLKTGTPAWLTTLKGESDRFVDVDATPVALGDTVYVTSSSGGVWALDQATGLVRWRTPLQGNTPSQGNGAVGGVASDGERLYVAAADLGIYALDLDGNVLWRQGTRGGGEPATPQLWGDTLVYALTGAGLYLVDKRTGELLEYFDPGDGVSADPVVATTQDLYVMSNRGVLYAFDRDGASEAPAPRDGDGLIQRLARMLDLGKKKN